MPFVVAGSSAIRVDCRFSGWFGLIGFDLSRARRFARGAAAFFVGCRVLLFLASVVRRGSPGDRARPRQRECVSCGAQGGLDVGVSLVGIGVST